MLHLRRPVGAIVGRADEIRALTAELERARLLSLIGPGGVGKTALAAELAHELEPDFERLVTVELADAERPQDPLRLLSAAVLGEPVGLVGPVAAALDAAPTLLLIDNCEHLVDEVAGLIRELLAATSTLTVVTTSRRPLGLATETIRTVAPLPAPRPGPSEPIGADQLVAYPAVQLFLERVYQTVPTFELTETNRPLVAEICAATDGVPLVLELAAALVRTTPLDEVLRAMTDPSARADEELTAGWRDLPDHQRSIGASLTWSRRFLEPGDQRLLDRLSVFVGGFTAAAATAVEPDATPAALRRLCDHSLLGFEPTTGRYRLLEVVRLDGAARLDPAEAEELADRHTDWCATVTDEIGAALYDPDPDGRFPRFEWELPNLCAALRRCSKQGDADRFRALLGPVALWWVHYMPPEDAELWAEPFADDEAPVGWRANVAAALCFLASHRAEHRRAIELADEARRLHDEADQPIGRALALLARGNSLVELGDRDGAGRAFREGLAAAVETGHPYPELILRVALARFDPDDPEAGGHLLRARDVAAAGFAAVEPAILSELGLRAVARGRVTEAEELCDQAVARASSHGYRESLATAHCARAEVALAAGDRAKARHHHGEALRVARQILHAGLSSRARAGLEAVAAAEVLAGTGDDHGETRAPSAHTADGDVDPLSERELSVARLLRGDLTQREIADELYIAPSTVKTHIKSIYRKLGVTKRSHAITRAGELGLFDRAR